MGSKLTDRTRITTADTGDLFYIVQTLGDTGASRAISRKSLDSQWAVLLSRATDTGKYLADTGQFVSDTGFALSDSIISTLGRNLIDDTGQTAMRSTLGLGTAAVKNTGASGDAIPLLDQNSTFSGTVRHDGAFGIGMTPAAVGGIYFNRNPDNPFLLFAFGAGTSIAQLRASGSSGIIGFTNAAGSVYGISYNPTSQAITVTGSFTRGSPVTKTADFTVAATENWLINNKAGSACVATLPAASSFPGRELMFNNEQAQQLNSASSNVVPLGGGAAGTAILTAATGRWAFLVSNGTNWKIMAGVV